MKTNNTLLFIAFICFVAACSNQPEGVIVNENQIAKIVPDYSEITIPVNIAPLNFFIEEAGDAFF
ncbi:MAG TPA: hypothetical protein P5210_12125, partial [Draconibacterium sp.]|nr:hypothetical protein [Draconibacterium sp.]